MYSVLKFVVCQVQKYVEEFSVSNFIGISKSGAFVSPDSKSILPSITNKMLMQLAADNGLAVEHRPLEYVEVRDFQEVGACGTATVVAVRFSSLDHRACRPSPRRLRAAPTLARLGTPCPRTP